jgi:hypothetical protein
LSLKRDGEESECDDACGEVLGFQETQRCCSGGLVSWDSDDRIACGERGDE